MGTKLVNIRATTTVRNVTPPILGVKTNVTMSTSDILNCLCRRAVVEEVFDNGTFLRLNLSNYYTDNDPNKGGPSCILGNTVKAVNELKRPAKAQKKEETSKVDDVIAEVEPKEIPANEPTTEDESIQGNEPEVNEPVKEDSVDDATVAEATASTDEIPAESTDEEKPAESVGTNGFSNPRTSTNKKKKSGGKK